MAASNHLPQFGWNLREWFYSDDNFIGCSIVASFISFRDFVCNVYWDQHWIFAPCILTHPGTSSLSIPSVLSREGAQEAVASLGSGEKVQHAAERDTTWKCGQQRDMNKMRE